jgi:hypothetical protein
MLKVVADGMLMVEDEDLVFVDLIGSASFDSRICCFAHIDADSQAKVEVTLQGR